VRAAKEQVKWAKVREKRGEEDRKWRLSVFEGVSWRCQSHIMAAWHVLFTSNVEKRIHAENTETRTFLYKRKM